MAFRTAGRHAYAAPRSHYALASSRYRPLVAFHTSGGRGRWSCWARSTATGQSTFSQSGDEAEASVPAESLGPLAADQEPLESLDDMAAFVERTRQEEEDIRRRREEVELQLLRMRQQEAVRRQQAIKLRLATERANVAVLREQSGPSTIPGLVAAPDTSPSFENDFLTTGPTSIASSLLEASSVGAPAPAPVNTVAASATSTGPQGMVPKKKLMLKKSKRMTAVAAAAGLHRVATPPPVATGAAGRVGSSVSASTAGTGLSVAGPLTAGSGTVGKALLSREELIEKRKEVAAAAASSTSNCNSDDEGCGFDEVLVPKPIFIISDCTGESAARTVRAALNQFEMRCQTQAPAQIMIYRFVESVDKMMSIINEAAQEDALVVYTLVDPKAVKVVQTACKLQKVRYVDLWTALLDNMEVHLNAVRSGVPASLAETRKPRAGLTDEYFRMIEAVEYTRKMDDGAHPQEWVNADLVILGVSRCGKTPLSIYLGQRGYKVANLPLIPGCPVPRELTEIDQTRIVGLIIDPNVLASIRRNRVNIMGVSRAQAIDYAEIKKINTELDWARKLYNSHPEWPVIDVTLRGIEETAARILKMLNDRRGDASPKWVEAYHAKQHAAATVQRPSAVEGTPLNIPEMIYGAHESTFLMQGLY